MPCVFDSRLLRGFGIGHQKPADQHSRALVDGTGDWNDVYRAWRRCSVLEIAERIFEGTMASTSGLNHLGLSVRDLDRTTEFFTTVLGWQEVSRDESYPRNSITDGTLRLTLWQVDRELSTVGFDRRTNIGLHHLAIEVESESLLNTLADKVAAWPGVIVEFMPELMGDGPRKHMMFAEPGGIRLELVWPGV